MQERGINSTFKKIIYESSEMVFLADDTYPYSIFYGNESFENLIGEDLPERNLVGLGLDINAYIFKEELIISHQEKDYSFRLELPQENGSNYFLFYKGKEVKTHGFPGKRQVQQLFKSGLDLIAIGQHDYLTYANSAVLPILGYTSEELLNTSLCPLIHEGDLTFIQKLWKLKQKEPHAFFKVRFKAKDGAYRNLECSVQFAEDYFYLIGRDQTELVQSQERQKAKHKIQEQASRLAQTATWYLFENEVHWDEAVKELVGENELEEIANKIQVQIESLKEGETSLGEFQVHQHLSVKGELAASILGDSQWFGVLYDTSEKQQLEHKLQLNSMLFEESPEALIVVRPDGDIFNSNLEARKLLGVEPDQKFEHLEELNVIFEETDQWKDWINHTEESSGPQRFSTLLINGLGKQLTLEIASKPYHERGEDFVLLSFKNISEKVSLEKNLEESSDFLMNLTEQVPGGLYQLLLDENGKMTFSFLSKGIGSVLGLSPQEIEGFTDISIAISRVHPLDLPQLIMSSVASAKKQEPWQCQFRVKNEADPTGFRWVLGAARPQSLDNGDMVWYGYLTDISQQKEFEAKLDEARKTAEKASQIKSDFLSMISHELRTPLNAISGSVYSLLQENPNKAQESTLNTINFAVENLIIMINDLLDFQKIEAGKLTIEKIPFQLEELVSQVIKGLSFHAKDSRNNLKLNLGEGLDVLVKGDKTRVSQILNNLITNALKFTNKGLVEVNVNVREKSNNNLQVYFEVKDNGIGIAPENQEKIFQDFDQVKPTFSTKYGGTGLGLSITKRLLNLMGGTIGLNSELGKGSTFFFELEFPLEEESLNGFSKTGTHTQDFSNLHILMAEDNDVNALVLGKIIKKWGYSYERVSDGLQALEAVKSKSYDVVLMDIQMPIMDGLEATSEIKKVSNIPVIALTAAPKLEIMERIQTSGFDAFVAKPIDAAELLKNIKDVVKEMNHNS